MKKTVQPVCRLLAVVLLLLVIPLAAAAEIGTRN